MATQSRGVKRSLTADERITLWEWLKIHVNQSRVDKERLSIPDITAMAAKALTLDLGETSVSPLIKRMGIVTPTTQARNNGDDSERLSSLERRMRYLFTKLGEQYETA